MTNPIGPVGGAPAVRRAVRRSQQVALARTMEGPQDGEASAGPVGETPEAPAAAPRRPNFATFAAQVLGGGPKRGLRGGQETLEKARATYLETEWSGPSDRRHRAGRITKTDV